MHRNHDSTYRRLFSHPEMVEDLLRRFVGEPWVANLRFETLETVSAHYVSHDLEQREGDLMWRLRWDDGAEESDWLYVYLLLEFQSTVDRYMALRVLAYLCLFYQGLITRGEVSPGGKLPPVMPFVLYNGEAEWSAAVEMADLIERLPGLDVYTPRFRYRVLDETHYPASELEPPERADSPMAAVIRLEQSSKPEEIRQIVQALTETLAVPGLRQDFALWLRRVILPFRLPGVQLPETRDLEEVTEMLEQRAARWTQEWLAEGFAKGRDAGLREGRELGRQSGRKILRRLLERKFGSLDSATRRRLAEASSRQLTRWADRLFDASSLDDVFSND